MTDAARLLERGELVVFGSGALAFWMKHAPASRDVDVWCTPAERGEAIEALMGELSWYHERLGVYVEVWGPETFRAPPAWRSRARTLSLEQAPAVTVRIPHPHDVLIAKLFRLDPQDQDHVRRILDEYPLASTELDRIVAEIPAADRGDLESGLTWLRAQLRGTEGRA